MEVSQATDDGTCNKSNRPDLLDELNVKESLLYRICNPPFTPPPLHHHLSLVKLTRKRGVKKRPRSKVRVKGEKKNERNEK